MIDNAAGLGYNNQRFREILGEMSERFKEPVLKTGDTAMCRGFESHSLRHILSCIWSGTQEAEGAPLLRE